MAGDPILQGNGCNADTITVHCTANSIGTSSGWNAKMMNNKPPKPPPSEKSTRRVKLALKILLFGQVFTFCLVGATMLTGSAGLGGLMLIIMALPVALGVAAFSVWAFVRRRPCRPLATAVFFAPVTLIAILHFAVRLFGEAAVTTACGRAAPFLPLAAFLLFPRTVGDLTPRLLRSRGACITYVVIQGLMIIPLIAVLRNLEQWGEANAPAMGVFVFFYPAISILAGVAGLLFGYIGLFRRREERFIGLSIAHMALSIALIAAAMPIALVLMVAMMSLG
jgi:hypothetical protein